MNYKETIKVIGFDLDQTLYPKSPEIDKAIQQYLYEKISEHRGVSIKEAEKLFEERYQSGRGMGGSATMKDLGIPNASELVQEALEKADIAKFLHPDPNVISLLNNLKKRYLNIDIVTGSNATLAKTKLKKLGIDAGLFNHIIGGEQGSKSQGILYELWMKQYPQLKPKQFLYIGDRLKSDHIAPKKIGIESILVYVTKPDPEATCPQLESLRSLSDILL